MFVYSYGNLPTRVKSANTALMVLSGLYGMTQTYDVEYTNDPKHTVNEKVFNTICTGYFGFIGYSLTYPVSVPLNFYFTYKQQNTV